MDLDVLEFLFPADHLFTVLWNLSILAVGLLGAFSLFRGGFVPLRRERRALRALRAAIDGLETPQDIVASAEVALRSHPRDLLVRQRLETLNALRAVGSDIDHDVLSAELVAVLDSHAAFGRWANVTVVLLGLAGTLLGLSLSVINVTPMLDKLMTDSTALTNILGTFAGLRTAFSATLMGIACTILLSLEVTLLRRAQTSFTVQLEHITLVQLLPYFRTAAGIAMAQAAQKLTELEQHMSKTLSKLTDEMSIRGRALTNTVEQSLNGVLQQLDVRGTSLAKEVEHSLAALQEQLQSRGIGLTATVDRSLGELTSEYRTHATAVLDQYKAAHEGVVRLLGVPQEDQLSLAENVNSLQLSVAGVRDAALGVERLIPRLEESIARQVDQQTKDLHEAINSYAARLNDGADRQEQLLTRTVGELGTFGPQIGAELGQHVAGHVQQLGVILLSLQAGIDSLGEATTRLTEDHGHEQIVTELRALGERLSLDLRPTPFVSPRPTIDTTPVRGSDLLRPDAPGRTHDPSQDIARDGTMDVRKDATRREATPKVPVNGEPPRLSPAPVTPKPASLFERFFGRRGPLGS